MIQRWPMYHHGSTIHIGSNIYVEGIIMTPEEMPRPYQPQHEELLSHQDLGSLFLTSFYHEIQKGLLLWFPFSCRNKVQQLFHPFVYNNYPSRFQLFLAHLYLVFQLLDQWHQQYSFLLISFCHSKLLLLLL